jgi:hypothetical protein
LKPESRQEILFKRGGMMKFLFRIFSFGIILFLFSLSFVLGQDKNPLAGFTIKGKAYFDYGYLLSSSGPMAESQGKDWNYFKFRRAYFTLEHKISEKFKFRFRTDADREVDDKARPFLKHVYLEWENLIPESKLYIELEATPTKEIAEAVWGYRGVERTLMDVYEDQTGQSVDFASADLGVALKGKIVKQFRYHLMFSNGGGYDHPEKDKYKKFIAQFQLLPSEGLTIAGYVDVEKQNVDSTNYTYRGDLLYKKGNIALGSEIFQYKDNQNSLKRSGFSLFGNYKVAKEIKIFARYDFYNPFIGVTGIDDDEISYIIIGFDYFPDKFVHVMPNIRIKSYADNRSSDIIALLTFELKY